MKVVALIVALLALTTIASTVIDLDAVEVQFKQWSIDNNKHYASDREYSLRLAVYAFNMQKVAELNLNSNGGAHFALNKFADLTADEFRAYLGFIPRNDSVEDRQLVAPRKTAFAAPDQFSWITSGKVTAVKDQAQCGSCWAFSATENIESVWMIAKGLTPADMKPLAPQQIVDCDKHDGGCNGGDTPTAYEYVISAGGMEPEADYPYRAVNEACKFNKADVYATISGYKYATKTKDENEMKDATATIAPLSICVDAQPWQFYSGGIMMRAQCGLSLDHCVQITGYDTSASTPYWVVRNSWGQNWGEKGFIRLQFGQNTCGLAEEATTAVV